MASLSFTTAAHAQLFTGGVAMGGSGSYSPTSLSFGSFDLWQGGTGNFASLDTFIVPVSNSSVNGLNGTNTLTLTAPLPTFVISSTTPAANFAFEMTSLTPNAIAGDYSGTGEFVDNGNVLTTTDATFTLSFSGPASYSFSADDGATQATP